MTTRIPALLIALVIHSPGGSVAQDAAPRAVWLGGLEYRSVSVQRLVGAHRIRQAALPLGFELARGRLSLDAGVSFASSTLTRRDGTAHRVSNLTDAQLRASYVFGRDAVVTTLMVNLPTGPAEASAQDHAVIGAVSPAFLAFPAPVYASGLSIVGGVATAVEAGEWSIGLAGSLKVSDRFTPYRDALGPLSYKPGVEGRVRAGADGLVGSSQLTLGLTLSTFGTDQLGAGGTVAGEYQPGTRLIAEGSLHAPLGSSALDLSVWSFYRSAGDTANVTAANQEHLLGGSAMVVVPVGHSISIMPRVEGRHSTPRFGSGRWLGTGLGLRFDVTEAIGFHPSVRYDRGRVIDASGVSTPFRGWTATVYARLEY
jgi:hypothetical protein